ncbi:MAG: stage II sporulation protein M [Armatimonadetes bacterium]|nr:stage II sporulation protein M [Armatimonadota bacterium]
MAIKSSATKHLEELDQLTSQVESHGLRSLKGEQVLRLGQLYRQAVSLLARARSRGGDSRELEELNALVSRAYQYVYATPDRSAHVAGQLFTAEIPQAVRRNIRVIALALLAMLLSSLVAAVKVQQDPATAERLMGRSALSSLGFLSQRHRDRQEIIDPDQRSQTGSFILVNNVRVATLAFAMGALAGVGSLLVLIYNGLMLGAFTAAVVQSGGGLDFLGFVAAHGVPELTAIALAGASGIRLGWSLLDPGDYARGEAFRQAAYDVIRIMMAVVLMLVWAALLEAFLSPNRSLPYSLKFTVAGVELLVLGLYFSLAGRGSAQKTPLEA